MENSYRNPDFIKSALDNDNHRGVIGGMWDVIGPWQCDYMVSHDLKPSDKLVDIGCGSLRGGIHFINYLDPFHYYGFDLNRALIQAGLDKEIDQDTKSLKVRDGNFAANGTFRFPDMWSDLDAAISISLFSHLNFNSMKQCLLQAKKILRPGAIYHTTMFLTEKMNLLDAVKQHDEVTSYYHQDPFHYTYEDVLHLAYSTGFKLLNILDVGHPRNQKMAQFQLKA